MTALPKKYILPVLILIYSMNYMDRSVLSIVGETMKIDLALSDTQLGLLHTILLAALIFTILPCSTLNDIFGRKKAIATASAVWAVAMAGTAATTGFISLLFARMFASVNEATVGAGGNGWLSQSFPPDQRAKIIGLFHLSAPFGMAFGTLFGGAILSLTGSWRIGFICFVIPALLGSFLVLRLPNNQKPMGTNFFAGFKNLFKKRTIIFVGCSTGIYTLVKFSYQAWLPILLIRVYHIEAFYAGMLMTLFLIAGIAGPFLGGYLADRWGVYDRIGRLKAAACFMIAIFITKFIFYNMIGEYPLWLITIVGLIDGLVMMMPLPVYTTVAQDVVTNEYRSSASGLIGTFIFLMGGAWGPLVVGFLSDIMGGGSIGLHHALIFLLFLLFITAAVYIYAIRFYRVEKID